MLWRAPSEEAANTEEMPDPSEGLVAVVSWVRPKVLRFALRPPPQPVPDLVLVSTLAVTGPARFVAHRSYQIGNTVVCVPPEELYIYERRDPSGCPWPCTSQSSPRRGPGAPTRWTAPGRRTCVRTRLARSGHEVKLNVQLGTDEAVALQAVVRHCRPFEEHAIAGLQFIELCRSRAAPGAVRGEPSAPPLPRVHAVVPVEYRSEKERRFR